MIKSTQSNEFVIEMKKRAREKHVPIYAAFELTARCNLNCKMCYVHDQDIKRAKSKELSTSQWKDIFDQAINEGLMFALLTGGECLLREDFEELYLYLFNRGIILSINTNGILIDEKRAAFFEKYQPERIQISIYGSSEDNYEQVTEKRMYSKVMHAFDLLEYHHLKPDVAITPSKYQTDFSEIMSFVANKGYSYIISPGLFSPRDDTKDNDYSLTIDDLVTIKADERLIKGKKLIEHSEPAPTPGCDCEEAIRGMPCNAGTIRAVVSYDGKMIPCMSIPEISISLLETSYHDAWEYIWRKMDQVVQPPMCEKCYYKKKCVYCPVLRYDGLFSGKCNSEYCEFMVKKYNSGVI